MKLDVLLVPSLIEDDNRISKSTVIMIDVLRASSTICNALANGARDVIPVDNVEIAARIYHNLVKDKTLLGGERNGQKISGFDLGNSPLEYTKKVVDDKTIVFTTTNGTDLFLRTRHAQERIVGCFVNMGAVLTLLSKKFHDPAAAADAQIIFLCAGTKGGFSYEDTMCAGAFIDSCQTLFPGCTLSDAAHAAVSLFLQHETTTDDFLKTTEHARYLSEIGFGADVEYCLSINTCQVVPHFSGTTIKAHPDSFIADEVTVE